MLWDVLVRRKAVVVSRIFFSVLNVFLASSFMYCALLTKATMKDRLLNLSVIVFLYNRIVLISSSVSSCVPKLIMSAGGCMLGSIPVATAFTPLLRTARSRGATARRILSRNYQSNIFLDLNSPQPLTNPSQRQYGSSSPQLSSSSTEASVAPNLSYQKKREELHYSSKLSLAPMMDYTTRHFRYLMRLITRHTLLYTEMVAANALCRCYENEDDDLQKGYGAYRFLMQHPDTGPSVLQLGGSDPDQLYRACQIISTTSSTTMSSSFSYTAINLNCGCPSPKVAHKGCFGAALMKQPQLVQELCTAMWEGCGKAFPITVKCRIGTQDTPNYIPTTTNDNNDDIYKQLANFIDVVSSNKFVTDFQIHSRIALLHPQVSPSQNRKIPPLQYDMVYRLVQDFPQLSFTLNGGMESLSQVQNQYQTCPNLHGVMVGRSMVAQPWHWSMADTLIYNTNQLQQQQQHSNRQTNYHSNRNRWDVLTHYASYATTEEDIYGLVVRPSLLKSLHGLFTGEPNARHFRIALNTILQTKNTKLSVGEQILKAAQECFTETVLFQPADIGYEAEGGRVGITSTYHDSNDDDDNQKRFASSKAIQEWQRLRKEDEKDNNNIVLLKKDVV